ncbi:hypothetical protein I7I51_06027 [Histoplasma capsulatum]|uniref:Uncharacterized protein n=1 Tax=Ajellomyces capsulatus TaxID=5037 RepID=A0A8A1MH22_AJECA|nr:hypothetical protein I7I51_06027 [Histoplasma capsulatum]
MGLLDPGKELKLKHGAFGVPEDGDVVKLKLWKGVEFGIIRQSFISWSV